MAASAVFHPPLPTEVAIAHAPGQDQLQKVRCYTLFFPGGRVYAGDTEGHLIALALVTQRQGRYSYTLEGNGVSGGGLESAHALLEAVASHLTADFVETQFQHSADLARADVFDLTAGPHLNIRLQAP
ncbi:hypothetical protein [Acidovorax sp.]|uniref:hypothetical protein n=1 Tax=Acidovorax sp. TaxID=1872122 RepID=UPI002ACE41C4|nr:hypothetical protein [Acidovorax sp.]MDZ7864140.1 hypothetical protein [Acidovorax sp.]